MKNLPHIKAAFLSGPPSVGKDTAVKIIDHLYGEAFTYGEATHEKFANPLRAAICGLLDITDDELERRKRSDPAIRQLMIGLSEKVVKPILGRGYFGKACAERVYAAQHNVREALGMVCISDAGFDYEIEAFVARLAELTGDKPYLEMWHILRPGHDFRGDSRSYPDVSYIPIRYVHNDGDKEDLYATVREAAVEFFGAPEDI